MGAIEILMLILQRVPDAVKAFQQIKATLSTHEVEELERQLDKVRGERKDADEELDRVLREKGV